jgi:hypothetical protein
MIIVHHLDDSRSQRILWLQEELGLPYEIRQHKRDPKSRLAPPELKRIHPLGKSPVIEDDVMSSPNPARLSNISFVSLGMAGFNRLQMTRVTTIMSIGCTTLRVPECLP